MVRFALHFAALLVLVFATYNPEGVSLVHAVLGRKASARGWRSWPSR